MEKNITRELLRQLLPRYPERLLLALDDWAPNYREAWVRAYSAPMAGGGGLRYVCVRGADDDLMVRVDLTPQEADRLLNRLPPLVDHRALLDLGFTYG